MEIREHGSLDMQKLLGVLSDILSDRYKAQITVTAQEKSVSYPSFSIAGIRREPSATVSAVAIPWMPPKSIEARTFT